MSDKFYIKGEESKIIHLGEPLNITVSTGKKDMKRFISVNLESLTLEQAKWLLTEGVLVEVRETKNPSEKFPTTEDVIDLAGKWIMGEFYDRTLAKEFLDLVPNYARFEILLRAAAVLIDRKYPDHINNAKVDKYFSIDMSNGKVVEISKGRIKNFKNFAAFRTVEDIKIATKLLRPLMKELWPNE